MGRFIRKLGFTEETVTSEDLCIKMLDVGAKDINKLMEDCIEYVDNTAGYIHTDFDNVIRNSTYIQNLKKQLKYEKNPMRRKQLQTELAGLSCKRCRKY